eukprot:CAMPEP_0206289576 /NCGR_PEP_ID=MMETSP0106_2-20121207/2185_1 /ASSEMBLY_ACC=CAM_ASM_000206 /TAXON_ID=81532 /ORGANISM="Acanthoeca-like sp., Strain 10tr" /LENGTH=1614 /DNA_ID=CAMNT_0053720129 /DNA_START=528 /DNA_END=5372 /DNA_ORIENTATION=-
MNDAHLARAQAGGSTFGNIAAEMYARKAADHERANKDVDTTSWSLYLFPYDSKIRRGCRMLIGSKYFEAFVLIMIMANCFCLAIGRPYPGGDSDEQNDELQVADRVFVVFFTLEMVVKIIALGVWWCGPTSYLKDGWNILDGSIVVIGVLSWALDNSRFSGARVLRAFRVFRPLRLVTHIDQLKVEIEALSRSVPQMVNVALLFVFFLVLYGIIGLEMYRQPMSNLCFERETDAWNRTTLIKIPETACGTFQGHPCDDGQTCQSTTYPRTEGMQSFNNAGTAILTVFVCTTLEGWSGVLYLTNDSNGRSDVNWIYFVSLIIFGAFLITNLVLGVISANFTHQDEALSDERRKSMEKQIRIEKRELKAYTEWMILSNMQDDVSLVDACRIDDSENLLSLPEGGRLFDDEFRDEYMARKRKVGWSVASVYQEDPEDEERDINLRGQDAESAELPHIVVKIPGEREVIHVGVNMTDTVGKIRSRVQAQLPDWLKTNSYMLQPNGHIASADTKVCDLKIVFRHSKELIDIHLSDSDRIRPTLYKQSSLTISSWAGTIAKSQRFTMAIMLLVFCNTILLGMEHYPQSEAWNEVFFWGEITFLSLFTLELSFKVYAFGSAEFWRSKFNRVDVLVTTASFIEFVLVVAVGARPVGISVWRCVRLVRAFRYTSYWDGMNDLATAQLNSIVSVLSLMLLLFIFVTICALLGMQLFGGRFTFDDETPRVNFDSFGSSLLAIFQVLTGEDWNVVMFNGIRAYGGIESNGWIAVIFFCFVVVVGNFTLLTVFLAIAMKALDDASAFALERDEFHKKWDDRRPGPNSGAVLIKKKASVSLKYDADKEVVDVQPNIEGLEHNTCVPPTNPVRRWITGIAFDMTNPAVPKSRPVFEGFILLCIIASSACLAAEDPVNDDAEINKNLEIADYVFTAIFTVEMLIKIVALGLVGHRGSYLRDGWNVLDCFVVVVSLVTYALQGNNWVKILRTLRVIRPLRMIKRAKGLQHVVGCMIVTVYTIGNVFMITVLLIFIFGVMGVQLFKGTYGGCNDASVRVQADCTGTFLQQTADFPAGVLEERVWSTSESNFDNIGYAMLTLFSASTTEGWVDVMFDGIDSTEPGEGPIENNKPYMAAYFVIFITVLTFFMLNIFVGYVVMTFASEGEVLFEETGLAKIDRQCIDYVLEANPIAKYQPIYRIQDSLIKFVESRFVSGVIMAVILANTVQLLMQFQGMSAEYESFLNTCNVIFLSFFIVECVLKILAYNPTVYMKDRWNVLDFVIVIAGSIDLASGGGAANVGFLRLFRIARVLKIVSKGEDMRAILFTFLTSFKALPYVGLLILLIFFIYAVMGMAFFAKVELDDDTEINRHNNFRDFGSSMMVLFRCSTGESWQAVMYACWYNEGGTPAAVPYFVSFTLLSMFLFLNLFVAVIMDNFEYLATDSSELGPQQLASFVDAWSHYDPAGTRSISHVELPKLLRELQPPLGFGERCPNHRVSLNLLKMNIPMVKDGTVDFNATLLSIVRFRREISLTDPSLGWELQNHVLKERIKEFWPRADPVILDRMLPELHMENYTVGLLHAVFILQQMYRMKRNPEMHGSRTALKAGPLEAGGMLEKPRIVKRRFDLSASYA